VNEHDGRRVFFFNCTINDIMKEDVYERKKMKRESVFDILICIEILFMIDSKEM
jgi:hypothetical protein